MAVIYFTVTNDLSYDQRMTRICGSLSRAGYTVILVGRNKKDSIPLIPQPFSQIRLPCIFQKGKLFYLEYNIRLFLFLLPKRMNGICAIDLDTIMPCYIISKFKGVVRIYDAHELFCEMQEIVTRPAIYKFWKWIERITVPKYKYGYTVNRPIADEFNKMYGCNYQVIRSIAIYKPQPVEKENFIIYQGAVNEGRSFETLIPAMQWIDAPLYICGDGNFLRQTRQLVIKYNVTPKVHFKGMLSPDELAAITNKAIIGITLFSNEGLSNYFSLANRFFDYMHAGTPQLCVDYPAYRELNNLYEVAVLISDLTAENIAKEINGLLHNKPLWEKLRINCINAATELNWQKEEIKLLEFYKNIFG